ncbi:MAG TPA: AmmeMemoRadiSam system protein B [Chloroflexota bacterium]
MTSETFPLAEQPRLRPIEIFPIDDRGQRGLVLRDPSDPDLRPIVVSDGAAQVLTLLDGQRSLEALSAALRLRGAVLTATQVRTFVERLDQAGYLEGPRAEHRLRSRHARFLEAPVRIAVHAGGAYPSGPDLLRYLEDGYVHRDGPGSLPGAPLGAPPRAVVAPHVDLHRGAPTYSWAYKAIAEAAPAELYVVLGTCHTPVAGSFAATRKPYDTPLGALPVDADFLARLTGLWGRDLFAGEFSHANEHSIEFQAVYLRSLGISSPMVAILCDSLHALVPPGKSPVDVPLVTEFVAAVHEAVAADGRSVTYIAAVDLAHVGRRFGDPWLVDTAHIEQVGAADHELLNLLITPDAEGYYQHVMRDRDARRICGFTPLYLLATLMQGENRQGELLRYTQWIDTDRTSSVTFASAIYR